MSDDFICNDCGTALTTQGEIEYGLCNVCLDRLEEEEYGNDAFEEDEEPPEGYDPESEDGQEEPPDEED